MTTEQFTRVTQLVYDLNYEMADGIHTYHSCICGVTTRRGKCIECLVKEYSEEIKGKKMAKAKLMFDLPEERSQFNSASDGTSLFCALWDVDQRMREMLKHGLAEKRTGVEVCDMVRDMINDRVNFERYE